MDNAHNGFDAKSIKIGGIQISSRALLIAFAVVAGLMIFSAISNRVNSKKVRDLRKENKVIAAENKELERQMDSLNRQYSMDSVILQQSIQETENLRQERQQLVSDIRAFSIQLLKFKNEYAKVSNYKHVPSDSLVRLFNSRFDY